MKKIFSVYLLFCFMATNLFAQQDKQSAEKPNEWSRWSLQLKGGIDVPKGSEGFIKRSYFDPEFGVELERTFNPLFGLSLEYMYMMQTNEIYDAHIHQLDLVAPVNLSNLLSPCRSWQRFSLIFSPGLGFGFGGYEAYDYEGVHYPPAKRQYSLNATAGLGAEYNVSSSFAIGLQGQFRWNSNNNHVPYLKDAGSKYGNGGYYAANLILRYKFAGKSNIRNTGTCREDIYAEKMQAIFKETERLKKHLEQDSIQNADRLTALKKQVDQQKDCCSGKIIPVTKPSTKMTLHSVYFCVDKWDLSPSAYSELNRIAGFMQENPACKIEIESHSDSRGSEEFNLDLSEKRSQSIIDYLVSKGIGIERMIVKNYGESHILNRCKNGVSCSEAEHAINRRTEFKIVNAPDGCYY